jgi:hypothetical protein
MGDEIHQVATPEQIAPLNLLHEPLRALFSSSPATRTDGDGVGPSPAQPTSFEPRAQGDHAGNSSSSRHGETSTSASLMTDGVAGCRPPPTGTAGSAPPPVTSSSSLPPTMAPPAHVVALALPDVIASAQPDAQAMPGWGEAVAPRRRTTAAVTDPAVRGQAARRGEVASPG